MPVFGIETKYTFAYRSEANSISQQEYQQEQSPDLSNSLSPASVYSDIDDYHQTVHAPPLLPTIVDYKSYAIEHHLPPIMISPPHRHYYWNKIYPIHTCLSLVYSTLCIACIFSHLFAFQYSNTMQYCKLIFPIAVTLIFLSNFTQVFLAYERSPQL